MPRITCDLPLHQATGVGQLPHISGLKMADPRFDKPGRIDILIGGKRLGKMILPQRLPVENSDIVAFNTVFSWASMGAYPVETSPPSSTTASVSHAVSLPSMDNLLCKIWETEEVLAAPCHSPEERSALEHFDSTNTLLPEGCFQVQLPRKTDVPSLGESYLGSKTCLPSTQSDGSRGLLVISQWPYISLRHLRRWPQGMSGTS